MVRVLVVDDHGPTIELMRLTLASRGHCVLTAANVRDALEIVGSDSPDVVLSDLRFPADVAGGQDGYALARRLRSDPSHADIVLLAVTGFGSEETRQAALASGFDDVVVKPFVVESLLAQIEALGGSRAS